MCRLYRVPAWLLVAVAALGVGQWSQGISAQQHPSATRAGLDTIQIRPNVYAIFGAGGNVTVHEGDDGLILIDTGSASKAESLLAAVRSISSKPIRLIINTGPDEDHVGGNQVLGAAGTELNPDSFNTAPHATVVAHENVMLRMSLPVEGTSEAPYPVKAWPTESYTSRTRMLYVNDDVVQIVRQTGAHSDGDSMVLFRRADVISTGDVLDLRQFPVIDPALGGSINGEIDALNKLLTDLVAPNMPLVLKEGRTLVVPGHGYISDYAEVVEYRDMVTVIRDTVEAMVKKGMTLAQVKAANPTRGYRARFGSDSGAWTTDRFVEAVFNGVKGS